MRVVGLLLILLFASPALAQPAAQDARPSPLELRPVLEPGDERAILGLLDEVGRFVELPTGYAFESVRIEVDRVRFELRPLGAEQQTPPVGVLLLTPRGSTQPSSASFSIQTEVLSEDPAVAAHLAAAVRSVQSRDAGDIYSLVEPDPGVGRPGSPSSTTMGFDIASALGASPGDAARLGAQLSAPLLVLAALALAVVLVWGKRRRRFVLSSRVAPTHVLPVLLQCSIYAYWSLYWAGVGQHIPVLLLLLGFGFAFDALLALLLRHRWELGFAPVPVVLSANLFVWFEGTDAWLGFLVVALALASKALLRRDGKHIVNPSAFGLMVVGALCLLWPSAFGYVDIAHQLALPPNMIEVVVLLVLVAQTRVPIVLVTVGAALSLMAMPALTGWVLLGAFYPPVLIIILLFATDPATIPRTGGGRLLYGLFVGCAIHLVGIGVTLWVGMDFWAKVLPVPLANALVPWFDRVAGRLPERLRGWLSPRRNAAHMGAWAALLWFALYVHEVKLGVFEPEAHLIYQTRRVRAEEGMLPRCAENEPFCRPFSFGAELRLWTGRSAGAP